MTVTCTCTCGQQPHRLICDLVLGLLLDEDDKTIDPPTSDPEKD